MRKMGLLGITGLALIANAIFAMNGRAEPVEKYWQSNGPSSIIILPNSSNHLWKAQITVFSNSDTGIYVFGKCYNSSSFQQYHLSPGQTVVCTVDIDKPAHPYLQFYSDKDNTLASGKYEIFDVLS